MTVFWILAVAMVALALVLVLPSLLRRKELHEIDRDQQNVTIARERLRELENERASGTLSDEQFEQARGELEQAVLSDVTSEPTVATVTARGSGRWMAVLVVLLVPALAGGLYLYLGAPQAIGVTGPGQQRAATEAPGQGGKMPSVEQMIGQLAARLEEKPDDARGWYLLGRSYLAMGRYAEAANALEKVYQLVGDQPEVLLHYADALAMAGSGRLSGKPAELIQKALTLEPDNPKGLWLAGMAADQQGDPRTALAYWRRLEPMLAEEPETQAEVRSLIQEAERKVGVAISPAPAAAPKETQATAGATLTVNVALAPALATEVGPTDTVFVFARALNGPPMPLAVARKQVSDLPLSVTLDDSMAMMPAMRLSAFDQVRVGARISKSGQANAQTGDLAGEVAPVDVSTKEAIDVVISDRVP